MVPWIWGLLLFGVFFGGGAVLTGAISNKRFVDLMLAAIKRVYPTASLQTRLLIAAHAAYETGWGKSTAFRGGWNAFNITRLPSDTRPIILGGDLSYKPDGTTVKITQRFAKYRNLDESVSDYLSFIARSRYTDAKPLLDGGSLDFIDSLKKGGYFELPLPEYKAGMQSVLKRVTSLLSSPISVA
jgi:flagellum-specific peptidoglycan hydrolase FlgJ